MPDPAPEPDNASLIKPGGKVDPVALRQWYQQAAANGGDDEGTLGTVRFDLQRDVGTRLDRYLTTRITFMSRTRLAALIAAGAVTVNGRTGKASTKLRLGDVVEVVIPEPPSKDITPEDIPLDVLFEDDAMIVINKHADIIVHPARSENTGTMLGALAWHFKHSSAGNLSGVGTDFARPGVVHRLDRNTSGVIVFAKTDEAHWKIAAQFQNRTADKRYLALIEGKLEPAGQVIDKPIGPHQSKAKGYREKMVVRYDDLGKPSVTIARVRERYRDHERAVGMQDFTLVELELKTGRTHQIRVHLTDEGHPIVGDDMYGGRMLANDDGEPIIARQALHAALLAIEHPITGKPMTFVAPPPTDFLTAVTYLRSKTVTPVHVESTVPLGRLGLA
jgi:23S rRNA pseudouridine1911/1915/1917 synthase